MGKTRKIAKLLFGSSAYGAPHFDSNIAWLTGFHAGDPHIIIEHDGKRVLFTNDLEYERAKKEARVDTVIRISAFLKKEGRTDIATPAALIACYAKKHGITDFTVEPLIGTIAHLAQTFTFVAPAGGIFPERVIKRPDEIEKIADLAKITDAIMYRAFCEIGKMEIRHGKIFDNTGRMGARQSYLTAEATRLWLNEEFIRHDAFCPNAIITSGNQAVDPHCIGSGPLLAHVPIVFDIFPRSMTNLYWYDTTRTVVKGKLTPEAWQMYETVKTVQEHQLSLARPGITGRKIHKTGQKMFTDAGYKTGMRKAVINGKKEMRMQGFFHGTGHGVGIDIHERPFISAKSDEILKPGMVITIEPGLYYYNTGGIRIEDTVVITETGHINLSTLSKDICL